MGDELRGMYGALKECWRVRGEVPAKSSYGCIARLASVNGSGMGLISGLVISPAAELSSLDSEPEDFGSVGL